MKNALFVLLTTFAIALAVQGIGDVFRKPDMKIGEIVFSPRNDEALDEIQQIALKNRGRIFRATKILKIYVMTFEPPFPLEEMQVLATSDVENFFEKYRICRQQIFSMIDLLENKNLVEFAQPNYYYYICDYTPNDPYFIDDGNYLPDGGADQYGSFITNCPAGWEISTGDPDVLLCIIDSGVDVDHPDLSDNIWINPGEDIDGDGVLYDYDDLNGIDDDGNGYVDDLFGYDFAGGNTGATTDDVSEEDWNPDIHYSGDDGWGTPDPSCGDGIAESMLTPPDMGVGHGTHCAGIAGAVMDNELMFAGAGGHISIVPVRTHNPEGSGLSSDMAAGIEYAAIIGADVASMSFGGMFGTSDPAIESACNYAYSNGVVLVAASGNEGGMFGVSSPASLPTTLAVGSFNHAEERSSFSNYGAELDVLASGGESNMWTSEMTEVVWSTFVISVAGAGTTAYSPGDHTIEGEVGTSMACPQAAGLAALIKSVNRTLSPDSVYAIIRNTARDIGTPGRDDETGYGIIDFGAALVAASADVKETQKPKNISMKISPNPANPTALISIELQKSQSGILKIANIAGKTETVLHSGIFHNGINIFRTPNNLKSGIYFAKFDGTQKISRKFCIIK